MTQLPIYQALYAPDGGPPRGFTCNYHGCKAVTRTERGVRMRLSVVHGVRMQDSFHFEADEPCAPADLPVNKMEAW